MKIPMGTSFASDHRLGVRAVWLFWPERDDCGLGQCSGMSLTLDARSAELAEQLVEVERLILFRQWVRPGVGRPIPGQLEPVLIRIAQVDGVGCPGAIRCRIDENASVKKAFQCRREIAPIRVADREVVKPSRLRGGWLTAPATPSVEAQMMVVGAEGEESSPLVPVLQRHSDKVTIEADRSLKVRDLEVNMADVGDGFAARLHRPEAYKHIRQVWFHGEDAWLGQRSGMSLDGCGPRSPESGRRPGP
jgi:hypothetical protein